MEIYNTLSGRKEVLKPRGSVRGKKFELFVCGITPYDLPHIGNARTYIFYDMMVRYLRSQGYEVSYLQNITDVDDKIILRAKELSMTPRQLARKFEREYMQSMKALGVKSVDSYQRATDNIPEIISQVERLLKKGYAYGAEDGVYYDISKFKDYGKLSGRTVQQAEDATSRIDESVKKRNRGDFALWKFSKKGEPAWPSLWGKGRPGWHIEDTAITEKHFGPQYDMHGGARDLIFPHHEAEIAQMEAVSGKKPLARYWVHTGFLTVGGEKMSKSLGNFVTVRDFLANHSPRLFRLLVAKTHYRSPLDYSEELLAQAERELERIDEFVDRLRKKAHSRLVPDKDVSLSGTRMAIVRNKFWKALDDDFNTPLALSVLFDLIREMNAAMDKGTISGVAAKDILAFLKEADTTFGFITWGRKKQKRVPAEIKILAERREAHRKQGNWEEADAIRAQLQSRGWSVEDTALGPKLKRQ